LQTVSAELAYDRADTGEVVILIVHQAIYIPHLVHNLLSTFQMILNDTVVNETLKFQCKRPTERDHAIIVKGEELENELIIPFHLNGVASCLATRKPAQDEFDSCLRFDLTFESSDYNLHSTLFS
jgi:hypothetical protein